ncbi:MAG: type III-B CRISPR-associated protein Cas10/Cmr2 [Methylobacter sp.]|nr:MAG: type III-B CRISPR-associated protein Cas10/Cmr2 [Methylobacter sp.]PPD18701.1 MAG: type III-B CRISPR-associated protein Cas10/Cmr2 [Methylobacter sp.]PPD32293.1 MAG: type III-B CRISPR-associated protein Cas10/Cmr2 [Methylomonas sp.]
MNQAYLVTLSIGPVQDFIAAARRTRDLWFGSYLLSEVSKAAALSFKTAGATLIFPSPESDLTIDSCANVGNKLLLIATGQPGELIAAAKNAAQNRWRELAGQINQKLVLNDTVWQHQIDDVLEFFAAWVALEQLSDYGAQSNEQKGRKRLEKLLNARKNTRNFVQNRVVGDGIPKSSLDGLRESVLPLETKPWIKRQLGLSDGEQLDCCGVVKRVGGNSDQFTPLSRLAIDPWLRYVDQLCLSDIEFKNQFVEVYDSLLQAFNDLNATNLGLVSRVKGNNNIYQFFPYDGQLLYDFRRQAETDSLNRLSQGADEKVKRDITNAQLQLTKIAKILASKPFNTLPPPNPYVAILVADGDRMGELLDSMATIESHQTISAQLAKFATRAPETVRTFRGHCIYAGGDDVLAILPVDQAIQCAKQLADDFKQSLIVNNFKADIQPTLSVGIGICHFLMPMGEQLDVARRAESLAKGNQIQVTANRKNALAILVQPRSGAEIGFRERWDNVIPADVLLRNWIQAHQTDLLPSRFGYQLRELSLALAWAENEDNYSPLITAETARLLQRKRTPGDKPINDDLAQAICSRAGQIGMRRLADELILTRHLAKACYLTANLPNRDSAHA